MNTESVQPLTTDFSGGMITWLIIYSIFFIASILYIAFSRKKSNVPENISIAVLIGIAAIAFFVKLFISQQGWEFDTDINCFTVWSNSAANNLLGFYETTSFCDYPPLYIYILGFFGKLTQLGVPAVISVRLPVLISELVIGWFIYKFAAKKIGNISGLILSGLWLVNPLTILDCAIWGQMDAVLTAFIIVAVYYLEDEKYILSAALFTASILIKPQGLFFLPVFIFVIIKKRQWIQFLFAPLTAIILTLIVIMPFGKSAFIPTESAFIATLPGGDSADNIWLKMATIPVLKDFMWLGNLYMGTAGTYNYISLNMANFWGALGMNLATDDKMLGSLSYATWGIILIVFVIGLAGLFILKSKHENTSWLACAFLNVGIVMLATRMHERYMFPIVAIMFIVFIFTRDWITPLLALGFTITNYFNVSDVLIRNIVLEYPHIGDNTTHFVEVSVANTILFVALVGVLMFYTFSKKTLLPIQSETTLNDAKTNNKKYKKLK